MAKAGIISVDEAAPYTEVLPPSACVPSPPRFTFGTFPSSVASAYYRATHLHGMGVYAGEKLVWSDGFVIDPGGAFIVGGQVHIHEHVVSGLSNDRRASILAAPTERLAGCAALIMLPGSAHTIYGHWLVDILPKLAVLEAAGYDWTSLWYPVPEGIPQFGLELMMLFGVPKDRIVRITAGRSFVIDTLLMPTSLHNGVRFSSMLYDAVALFRRGVTRAGGSMDRAGPTRMFLARKGRNRLLTNRARIEEMARSAGFEIVYPETKLLPEQIALFSSAREIVGEYGSAFHTAMFSHSGTVVCGLRSGQLHPAFIQSGIGETLKQSTGYVFGQPDGDPARYDYEVPEDVFHDCLKTVFDHRMGLAVRAAPAALQAAPVSVAGPQGGSTERVPAWRRFITGLPFRTKTARMRTLEPQIAAAPSLPEPFAIPAILLMGHVQDMGDTQAGPDGWLGQPGSSLAIEGIRISLVRNTPSDGLQYQVLLADDRLSEPVRGGVYCGTRGKGLPLFGLVLRVDAAVAAPFSFQAEGHFRDGSVVDPVGPGEILRAATQSPLTALRIIVKPVGSM